MSTIIAPRGHKRETTAISWGADNATNGQITPGNTPITVAGKATAVSGLYVGTTGTLVLGDAYGNVGVFLNVASGTSVPFGALYVFATAPADGTVINGITYHNGDGSTTTTAANILPLW